MGLDYSSVVDAPITDVFDWYARPGAFGRLSPPWQPLRLVTEATSLEDGRATLALPGIAFAEWGPGDHNLWLNGYNSVADGGESGHPVLTEISDLHGEIDTLRETVFTDPLALAGQASRAERITARLDAARDQVDALGSFRTEAAERMRRAAADIESVGAAESAARQARERARAKIAVSLPTVGDSVATLRDQLDEVRALSGDGRWPKAQESMAVLTSAIAEALRRANSARDTATALLGRRDELRGRLDAYRAKAARIGFAEDAELTAGYQRARELLWRAPCDLAAATRALAAYQRLITDKETR